MALLTTNVVVNTVAQTKKELRDSIVVLAREVDLHPDSIELRLRKAALNLQLEQWQYAKEEYDNQLIKVRLTKFNFDKSALIAEII